MKQRIFRVFRERRLLIAILGVGFLVRVWGVWYGLPLFFVGDEHHLPGAALKMGAEKNLIAHYETLYEPPFLAYLYLFLYGITFPLLMLVKGMFSISELQEYIILNPTFPWIVARLSSVLMGTALIYLTYRISRFVADEKVALVAALFVAFDPMMVQMSHFARIWVPAAFFAWLSLYFSSKAYQKGNFSGFYLSALFSGCAAATNWISGMVFVSLLVAFFVSQDDQRKWKAFLGSLIGYLGIIGITIAVNPYNFLRLLGMHVYGQRNIEHITDWKMVTFWENMGITTIITQLKRWLTVLSEYNFPVLLMAVPGIICLLSRNWRKGLILVCYPFLHFCYIMYSGGFSRYMLPIIPMLAIGAAVGVVSLDNILRKKVKRRIRYGLPALVALVVSISFILTILWDFRISSIDTREEARTWIEKNILAGSKVAMSEYNRVNYFYLNENREAIELARKLDPSRIGVERKYLMGFSGDHYPHPAYFTVHINEQGIDRSLPADLIEFLHKQGFQYLAVAFWQEGKWAGNRALEKLPKVLLKRFSPGRKIMSDMVDDMRRPFATLWHQKRPGPVVEIYRIVWEEWGENEKRKL